MSLEGVSLDQAEGVDIFDPTEEKVRWNYHAVEELGQKSQPVVLQALSAKHETEATMKQWKDSIKLVKT